MSKLTMYEILSGEAREFNLVQEYQRMRPQGLFWRLVWRAMCWIMKRMPVLVSTTN